MRAERFGPRTHAEDDAGPPVVVADFDPGAGRTPLSTAACRAELERLGITLHEGLRLRLQRDDTEVDAVARWDADWGGYMAEYERSV
jgi:hypothetical protein